MALHTLDKPKCWRGGRRKRKWRRASQNRSQWGHLNANRQALLRRGVASKCGRARAVRKTGPFPPAVHRALRGGALPEQDVAVRRMLGLVPGGAEAGRNTDSNRGFCIGGRDGRSSPPWFSRLHV